MTKSFGVKKNEFRSPTVSADIAHPAHCGLSRQESYGGRKLNNFARFEEDSCYRTQCYRAGAS